MKGSFRISFFYVIMKYYSPPSDLRMEHSVPLSYEQALAMGRTGRILGSPVLNGGYKSKGLHARHSDSDEEDWC